MGQGKRQDQVEYAYGGVLAATILLLVMAVVLLMA